MNGSLLRRDVNQEGGISLFNPFYELIGLLLPRLEIKDADRPSDTAGIIPAFAAAAQDFRGCPASSSSTPFPPAAPATK
jgi:hypothetical protein